MTRLLLALATGVLAFLSLPGVGFAPLAFVAWVPLLVALDGATPRASFGWTWVSGFVLFAFGSNFFLRFLLKDSGIGDAASTALFFALVSFEALRAALAMLVAARAARNGWSRSLVFLLAYGGAEALFPMPFPWTFGAPLVRFLPLAQVAELGGPVAISLVALSVNLAIFAAVKRKPNLTQALAWSFVPFGAFVFGSVRIQSLRGEERSAPTTSVGVVHTHQSAGDARAFAAAIESARALVSDGAEWIVFPEAALGGPFEEDEVADLGAVVATQVGAPTVVGLLVRSPDGTVRNSAVVFGADGDLVGRYDKRSLIPFGEQFPFAKDLPSLAKWSARSGTLTAGEARALPSIDGARLAIDICFEDTLAEAMRQAGRGEHSDVLVNLTNDGWFADSFEPELHLALARARAIEHRRFMIRSTNSGVSAVIDSTGRVVQELGPGENGSILAKVSLLNGMTFYEAAGDGPFAGTLAIALTLCFIRRPGFKGPAFKGNSGFSPSKPS